MAEAIELTTELIRSAQVETVYTRENWADDWQLADFLEAASCEWTASPTIGTAELRWRYGRGMRQQEAELATVEPLDLDRHWVKIEIAQDEEPPKTWYGQILISERLEDGALVVDDARVATGAQTITAYELDVVLARQKVLCSIWDESAELELGRGLTFNEPNQVTDTGNRSAGRGATGTHVFTDDLTYGEKWSTRKIVRYLFAHHAPTDFLGNPSIMLRIDQVDLLAIPDDDEPELPTHGRTLKQLLDRLLDRRRLLSYTVTLQAGVGHAGDDAIRIKPFTYADEEIEIPERDPIRANPIRKTLDFDLALEIDHAAVKTSAEIAYDQVQALGARVLCCGTVSFLDSTLATGWAAGDQTDYDAGASNEAGYAALDRYEKQQRNRDFRAAEHLDRVYRYFSLVDGWDETVGNGEGGAKNDLFPYDDLDLVAGADSAFYLPDLRFLRFIPLKDRWNYQTNPPTEPAADGQKWEYRRPFVVLKLQDEIESAYGKYELVERLGAAAGVELTGDGRGRHFALSVRTQDDAPGLICSAVGAPQHVIATGIFAGPDDTDEDYLGDYTYADNLLATVAIRSDYHCRAIYPENPVGGDAIRILTIDASAIAELHYVAPNTVVDLDDGDLVRLPAASDGFIRDDRDLLRAIARMAFEWYGTPRRTLHLAWNTVRDAHEFDVGDLITQIGADETAQDIRTVITTVRVDLATTREDGDRQFHRTTIQTQWAQLDALEVL